MYDKDYEYEKFEDWFDELESFSLRSERFFSDVPIGAKEPRLLIDWLRAAFESGRETK